MNQFSRTLSFQFMITRNLAHQISSTLSPMLLDQLYCYYQGVKVSKIFFKFYKARIHRAYALTLLFFRLQAWLLWKNSETHYLKPTYFDVKPIFHKFWITQIFCSKRKKKLSPMEKITPKTWWPEPAFRFTGSSPGKNIVFFQI